ncbi:hypothetical protein C8A05DRAFT_14317, partial [Staphylotrichum tortipilum]
AVIQRLVRKPATRYDRRDTWVGYCESHWRSFRRVLGFHPTREAAVLAELAAALKNASEAALGSPISVVSVTAPSVATWYFDTPADSAVNDALVSAGLELGTMVISWPVYLDEASAVLAASGRWHCRKRWCGVRTFASSWPNITYSISFTNDSLYTAFQPTQCFFEPLGPCAAYPPLISTPHGLSQLASAPSAAHFWNEIRTHLLSEVAGFSKIGAFSDYSTFTVLTAGEAADHPDFLTVVRDVAGEIPRIRKEYGARDLMAELVVSEEPGWAAARGAAFWLHTRMNSSYCDGVERGEWDWDEGCWNEDWEGNWMERDEL